MHKRVLIMHCWRDRQVADVSPYPHPPGGLASLPLFYLRWSLLISQFRRILQLLGTHSTSGTEEEEGLGKASQVELTPGAAGLGVWEQPGIGAEVYPPPHQLGNLGRYPLPG